MENRYYNSLIEVLLSISSKKEMKKFLAGMLTPKELLEISVRLEIVKLLKKGIPQHQIASKLGVGIATVTRGSKEVAKGSFSLWR